MAEAPSDSADQIDAAPERIDSESAKPGLGWFFTAVFTLPLLYVLLMGPLCKIAATNALPSGPAMKALVIIYSPLRPIYHNSTYFHAFIDWYLKDVWGIT